MNLKNVSLLNFEELRSKIAEGKKKKSWWRKIKSIKKNCNNYKHS
jgi:hypothetical protein